MTSLFADALKVFETAAQTNDPSDFGIVVDRGGAIRVVVSEGWRIDALQSHYGADTVFQVRRDTRGVRVTAQAGRTRCTLETTGSRQLL